MAIGMVSPLLEALSFHFLTTGLAEMACTWFTEVFSCSCSSANDILAVLVGSIQIWWFSDDETERWSSIKRSFAGQERQPQLDSLGGGVLGADRSWRKKLKKKLKNVAKKVAPIAGQLASTALKASGVPGAAQAGNMLDAGLAHGRALDEQDRQPLTESFMSGQDRKPVAARGQRLAGWNGHQTSKNARIAKFKISM